MNAAAPKDAKEATKDKAGKPKEVKTGSTKTVTKDAPARENAEDAELDKEEVEDTAKTYGKTVGKAEDEDDRDHEKFRSWEAGERLLRAEERKIKFRTMIRAEEWKVKVQASLKEEERKIQIQALKELERKGKFGDVQEWKKHLQLDSTNDEDVEEKTERTGFR